MSKIEVHLNKKTLKQIDALPDKVVYEMARRLLDMTQVHIPMSALPRHSGTLRRTTMSNGVKKGTLKGDYYVTSIGSPTRSYANRVWNLPDSTNWTTPNTHPQWFKWSLKKYKNVIVRDAIDKARKGQV